MSKYHSIYTVKAPVNIALIKYWGKSDENLKIPINDSLSATLNTDHMCATTTLVMSDGFVNDEFWLNSKKQDIGCGSLPGKLIEEVKKISPIDRDKLQACKVHIVSENNFPTAAGLASSAAGYACLAFVLGAAYGVEDPILLSRLARIGSGSACRSLFGGFVQWIKGSNHDSSMAKQIVNHDHWPEMRVVICVVNDQQKDTPSNEGMRRSVKTSELINHRANIIVPDRITEIKKSILDKDFNKLSEITMKDSNQFHAICLDSYPPIFYLNDTSRRIIKICSILNDHYDKNVVAYTFDAGPNACLYSQDDFVDILTGILTRLFPTGSPNQTDHVDLTIKGIDPKECNMQIIDSLCKVIEDKGISPVKGEIKYLISTNIGDGPKLVSDHLKHASLEI